MDYLPIGLQATDVLVDKHFHRIPDKAFRSETYRPRIPTKLSRRKRREEKERRNSRDQGIREIRGARRLERATQKRQEEPYSNPEIEEAGYDSEPDYTSRQRERNMRDRNWDSKWERDSDLRDIPRHSGAGTGTGYVYGYPYEKSDRSNSPPSQIYSQQPPRLRPEYLPKYDPFDRDERRGNYDSDERYEKERTRRPKPIQRSSSYDDIHSQRKSYSSNQDQRLSTRNASRTPRSDHGGSKDSHTGTMKDRAERYGVKDEVKGLFTDSPQGLAGGAIGALVGGWATEKFQESQSGKDRKDMGDRAKIITLLGAAAGGLVANAVVDKWQDGKEETKKKQKKWDKKYPDGKTDDNGERGDRDEGRNGESERERRDSVRSRDASRRDRNRDDSRERDMSFDEKIRRSDGRRYEGVNDGYY
ncbi:hypothetical protein H4I96_08347 [Botrytis cinerea]